MELQRDNDVHLTVERALLALTWHDWRCLVKLPNVDDICTLEDMTNADASRCVRVSAQ